MAIKLHQAAYDHAKKLIEGGLEVNHQTGNWHEAAPTRDEIAKFLETHYISEYALWFLGVDTDIKEERVEKYHYPYGDLKIVYKSALLEFLDEARKKNNLDIVNAIENLIKLVDKKK